MVAPSNDATHPVYDDIENHVDWRKVKEEVVALAEIEKQEAIDLAATQWPQEVAGYIDEMIRREINTYSILYTARDATDPVDRNGTQLIEDAGHVSREQPHAVVARPVAVAVSRQIDGVHRPLCAQP